MLKSILETTLHNMIQRKIEYKTIHKNRDTNIYLVSTLSISGVIKRDGMVFNTNYHKDNITAIQGYW